MVPRELPVQSAPACPVNDVEPAVTRVAAKMLDRRVKIVRFIVT